MLQIYDGVVGLLLATSKSALEAEHPNGAPYLRHFVKLIL